MAKTRKKASIKRTKKGGQSARKSAVTSRRSKEKGRLKRSVELKKKTTVTSPLSKEQGRPTREEAIKSIKAELLRQKSILLGEAGATINNMPAAILYPDLGDQAEMEIERNFLLRLRGREQKLLKKIDEALERIENGTFGLCEICGREIDIRRLMARPVTTMCIECKMEQEEEERIREL